MVDYLRILVTEWNLGKFLGVACDTVVNSTYLNRPSGIAIDGAGDYVVADNGHHRIVRCSPWPVRSQCVTVVGTGTLGSGPAQLRFPQDVAMSADGAYLIADTSNHRIQRCPSTSPGSDCVTMIGTDASCTPELLNPSGVGLDADGALLIVDTGNHRILRCMEVSVRFVCVTAVAFGGFGNGPTQLWMPRAVVAFVPSATTWKTSPRPSSKRNRCCPNRSAQSFPCSQKMHALRILWVLQETFFERLPAREGQTSTIFDNSKNLAYLSLKSGRDVVGNTKRPEIEMRREPKNSWVPAPPFQRWLECTIMLVELVLTVVWSIIRKFPITSKLKYVQRQHILISQCTGSKKLR